MAKSEKKRQHYTAEFKREAVRLLESGAKSGTELCRELGVGRTQLYKWQADFHAGGVEALVETAPGRKPGSQTSEIARLKRELAAVTEERDILKKAAAYFAKNQR